MNHVHRLPTFVLSFLLVMTACRSEKPTTIDDLQRQILELSKSASNIDLKSSLDELKRAFRIEYGVFNLSSTAPEELTKSLNALGEQRWDCFSIQKNTIEPEKGITVYCKRAPESVLRYLPPGFAGGMMNLLH